MKKVEIKAGVLPEAYEVRIRPFAEYCKDGGDIASCEFLKIEAKDSGGGMFYEINTQMWSVDSLDDLIEIINDFKQRFPVEDEKDE